MDHHEDSSASVFLCSICLSECEAPVSLSHCGHNFCRECLTTWMSTASATNRRCPDCRRRIDVAPEDLQFNRTLAAALTELRTLRRRQHPTGRSNALALPFNDIVIGERVGSGRFAVVHRGLWQGTPVALKVLNARFAESSPELTSFMREIHLAAHLRHPNIVALYGFARAPDHSVILVAKLGHRSVWDLLRNGGSGTGVPLPISEAMRIAIGLVRAVVYLHGRSPPIVHCDIKSPNLILDDHGVPMLADFGVSRELSTLPGVTISTGTRGTAAWCSPENFDCEDPHHGKPASDVYSLGVVINELLRGECPFAGRSDVQIMTAVLNRQHRPVLAQHDDIPAALLALIKEMWAQDPLTRPSASAVLQRLLLIETERSSSEPPDATANAAALPPHVARLLHQGNAALVLRVESLETSLAAAAAERTELRQLCSELQTRNSELVSRIDEMHTGHSLGMRTMAQFVQNTELRLAEHERVSARVEALEAQLTRVLFGSSEIAESVFRIGEQNEVIGMRLSRLEGGPLRQSPAAASSVAGSASSEFSGGDGGGGGGELVGEAFPLNPAAAVPTAPYPVTPASPVISVALPSPASTRGDNAVQWNGGLSAVPARCMTAIATRGSDNCDTQHRCSGSELAAAPSPRDAPAHYLIDVVDANNGDGNNSDYDIGERDGRAAVHFVSLDSDDDDEFEHQPAVHSRSVIALTVGGATAVPEGDALSSSLSPAAQPTLRSPFTSYYLRLPRAEQLKMLRGYVCRPIARLLPHEPDSVVEQYADTILRGHSNDEDVLQLTYNDEALLAYVNRYNRDIAR